MRDLSGFDAVILWRKHLRGDRRALELLVEYNRADVVHLKTILATCYDRLVTAKQALCSAACTSAQATNPESEPRRPAIGAGHALA